jgi:hypothetical protein
MPRGRSAELPQKGGARRREDEWLRGFADFGGVGACVYELAAERG